MPWLFHDDHDDGKRYVYDVCGACLRIGRVYHIGTHDGQWTVLEGSCPQCGGLGYLTESARPCDTPAGGTPPPSPEVRAALSTLSQLGYCPDCLGVGCTISTEKDGRGKLRVIDVCACRGCAGSGRTRPRSR